MSDTKPGILAITTLNGYLYAVSKSGYLLPMYYYGPLAEGSGPVVKDVDFIDDWADYAQGYAGTYSPVPVLDAGQLPDDIEANFGVQPRTDSPSRNWEQAVYGGYPLYIYGDGTQDDPAAGDDPLQKAHMFARAPITLSGGPITGKLGVDDPPQWLGP